MSEGLAQTVEHGVEPAEPSDVDMKAVFDSATAMLTEMQDRLVLMAEALEQVSEVVREVAGQLRAIADKPAESR